MIKSPRGTRDLLPPDTALWNFVEDTVRKVFRAYNFHEIRTPIFESTELFARGVGEETDIVSKEMFTWYDRGRPVEDMLVPLWLNKHQGAFDSFELNFRVPGSRAEIDLVAVKENSVSLIEAKARADGHGITQLRNISDRWELSYPDQPRPRLVLLVPANTPIPDGLLASNTGMNLPEAEIAKIFNIVIEKIDLPEDTEYPQSLTLRPENTAGIVRAYIEHKLWERGLNKFFSIGPMFRRERPQKGRYRQFYQIDAEVIGPPSSGSQSPVRDAEILELLATLLDRVGITNWTLVLNSVGCPADRAKFNEALRQALAPVVDKMCVDCQRRAVTNPLRVFDCKVPADQPIIETLPTISQFLDEDCRMHYEQVKEILNAVAIPFVENPRLVRGLDYYQKTAFEFTHGALGAQNAILGGGRYDGLSEALGGPAAPGIGFAIGEDRLVLSLMEATPAESVVRKPDVYIAPLGTGMNREAARLARELRRHDLVVELGDESFRPKKSIETADKMGSRYVLIVGGNEVAADAFSLKHLASGEQVTVPRAELAQRISQK
jgi:histidyl-tRNA synthetase